MYYSIGSTCYAPRCGWGRVTPKELHETDRDAGSREICVLTSGWAAGFNPLDATSVIAATGLVGIFCVLVAETGLLVGVFLPGAQW